MPPTEDSKIRVLMNALTRNESNHNTDALHATLSELDNKWGIKQKYYNKTVNNNNNNNTAFICETKHKIYKFCITYVKGSQLDAFSP